MTRASKKMTCPLCGRTLNLTTKPNDSSKLVASCDCGSGTYRNVIETDDPNYLPFEDRLESGEPAPEPRWKGSKR